MYDVKNAKLYVVLPFFNGMTEAFLENISSQSFENFQIILVDDGSVDDSLLLAQKYFPKADVIQGRGDWWWGGSLHQAYLFFKDRSHDNEYICVLNHDVVIAEDFFSKALERIHNKEKALLVAQAYCKSTRELIDSGVHINWQKSTFEQAQDEKDINCLSTRGMIMKLSDFVELGGFYPNLLPHYLSDYEFTCRAQRKGLQLITHGDFKLYADQNVSGYHNPEKDTTFFECIQKLFSKKCPLQPFYRTSFIFLTCPMRFWPINLIRVWGGILKITLRKLLNLNR